MLRRSDLVASRFALALVLGFGLTALVPATSAVADPPQCPTGYNLGPQTFEQRLLDPKVQAALAAGVITIEQGQAIFSAVDENGNGVVCVQDIAQRTENANERTLWIYFDIVRDDLVQPTG